ncbi:MAG: class IIb bacteriocin, lactobin A/cerein 7B family [Lactobacillales bacterium]|jgi:lactobin A/cerein 7B family class IIb bacteriocin|nr:class IIb bacteriocin, lactobin A/cerein 7B family [Lactobacillales bacterium]
MNNNYGLKKFETINDNELANIEGGIIFTTTAAIGLVVGTTIAAGIYHYKTRK